jgi:hypothetical protein
MRRQERGDEKTGRTECEGRKEVMRRQEEGCEETGTRK